MSNYIATGKIVRIVKVDTNLYTVIDDRGRAENLTEAQLIERNIDMGLLTEGKQLILG